ncbi:hypothetical protein AMATHDRAFT_79965 [Amanita thiersii Skay4041]|uniref:N-alpha-acetyltransferase 60 n=1 Tax=Amanita thiersii Skay4041 TaxID=703135 RepID=A0A2A9NM34_9AGAR|nr:hypothetical protein AMATHDRAFT_79965 [Amanita thiersii Skay4041]
MPALTLPLHDDIVVRPITSLDIPTVREIHSDTLPISYPVSFFLQLLVLPARLCLIAHPRSNPANIVGFISAVLQPQTNSDGCLSSAPPSHPTTLEAGDLGNRLRVPRIEILTLGVLPAYQQRGLARHLVQCMIQNLCTATCKAVLLYANVAVSNNKALKFYEHMGLRVSSEVISNLYRTCINGTKDGYLLVGMVYR